MTLHRVFRSALYFISVLAAYWLYALAVVPLIEPSPRYAPSQRRPAGDQFEIGPSERLSHLFPEGAWELEEPKFLEMDRGMLLYREYQPADDHKSIQLKPVTLVIYVAAPGSASGERRPLILQAPEGALLHFDEPLDLGRASVGKLERGRLLGQVTIRSPQSEQEENQLHVVTRNVEIEPKRIWTPHPVNFRLGRHYGSGRDLSIRLEDAKQSHLRKTDRLLPGVASLELVRVERIHLELPADGPFPSSRPLTAPDAPYKRRPARQLGRTPGPAGRLIPAERGLRCAGRRVRDVTARRQ